MIRILLIATISLLLGQQVLACGVDGNCNPNQICCDDPSYGPRCVDSSQYDCPMNEAGINKLCPKGQSACGDSCYKRNETCCLNGTITPQSECNKCGDRPFNPATQSCTINEQGVNVICPKGAWSCGSYCYNPNQLCCRNGRLRRGEMCRY
eukprot:TRINITY_DN5274_c0_g1_i1.p1 TRINITY_DN5274_c0_g1~~TRINITY_DN5274_c0_g1_i1.p1  ORF type:complete len:151 (-),score=18.07 TRINITY_DN5274_c0_g1_i1:57-509(-)